VIKVGGSLSARPRALTRLMTALGALARGRTLVVVPGGGPFANEVRRVDRRFGLADSAAHWMAILAMDQFAYVLAHLAPGAAVVRRRGDITAGRLNVLAPTSWLTRADPLPHSWEVTSDSIAAWVARRLHARMLVLLKDVDGFFERDPGRPRRGRPALRADRSRLDGVVDANFGQGLGRHMPCWIVNGVRPERVRALLETGRTYGTEVV
jgi:5-(aminomethyl)-3-furanmethanol phosphate kinase